MGERGVRHTIDVDTDGTAPDDDVTVDDDVTAAVYRENAAELLRMATMMVGPSDAHDVFVEAVLSATRASRWAGLDADQRRAYLYRSTVNRAREWARSTARRRRREAIWASRERVGGAPAEAAPEVWEALADLSTRQRAVVFLTYWEDLDGASIADRLGISLGTVRRYQARARKQLRRRLA